ncbi:putative opaque-phase-specific protein OP4 [[Candida] railenensis]|uniref:Opaque-phase-specific protein OP4 n=1 Tax=[Candida] railenensis TaxID=45579 RepID=A0A9P0QMB6_9ASCO|nr:putative opaque-phase-specific protein OP4 [[Candida] railenensis]
MKFSQATLLAILATSAFVSAAPTETVNFESTDIIVTRQDANEILDIIAEIKSIHAKRDFAEGEEYHELSRRADSLIGNLITAFANSGILGTIWNTLTTDETLKSEISGLIKSAVQAAIVQGPALIKAVWNSGLIGNIFNEFLNDTDLQSALLAVGKSLFSSAANLLLNYGGSSTTTAAAAAKRDALPTQAVVKRESYEADVMLSERDILDKRDLSSLITTIVTEISNSGIITTLINKVLANPEQSISLLTSALKQGLVLAEDLYSWAKSSGVLDSALTYIQNNGGAIVSALGKFLAAALGSGTITADQINSAGGTTTATTAAAAATTLTKRMLY